APDNFAPSWSYYGNDGGYGSPVQSDANLITVPNPEPGIYSVLVQAIRDSATSQYPDASYTLRVKAVPLPQLNFTASQNTNGLINSGSGLLADNQRAFFRVEVPAAIDGMPVIGWYLDASVRQGNASLRVRKDLLPLDDPLSETSPYNNPAYIVAPYLTPGTWYMEVRASGAADFTVTSSALVPQRMWMMPEPGQPTTTPGLTAPEFGDSGTDTNGNAFVNPRTGDRGIDLEQGHLDYYAIIVPTNNGGLLRTVLDAISGNPDLYIRAGAPPTLSHGPCTEPWCPRTLFDRSQTGTTTEYGNWVPLDGHYE